MIKAKKNLGIVLFPAFDWAISETHPEREERLLYTKDQLFEEGIGDIEGIKFFNPLVAKKEDVERVHFCVPNVGDRVTKSHLVSVGGAIRAAEAVSMGEVDKAFALIRPPGHHAHKMVYGDRGFCIVNMEAIMIEHMRKSNPGLKVAIIDSDCHHGDGTQDIYWNDKNILFISFHQDGRTLYPGTGSINELGGPSAYGYNLNIPLPPGTGDEGFLHVLDNVILPVLDEYKPDIIINSAGQDNHYSDPLTNMNFTARGYATLNERLNPDIAVLEGGYSIEGALPYINLGIILAMAGIDYSNVAEPDLYTQNLKQSPEITSYIEEVSKVVYNKWKNRHKLRKDMYEGKNYLEKDAQIYYDTDGIMDRQKQGFHICDKCAGLNTIESKSSSGFYVFAISIPIGSCKKCLDKGYKMYKEASLNKFTNVYLQDRVNDRYLKEGKIGGLYRV
ncbi:MAG: histone deacetylase [Epulopiscium sp.]|nr:histone deacetylase [Candidatus Epulonipiscium sp.]